MRSTTPPAKAPLAAPPSVKEERKAKVMQNPRPIPRLERLRLRLIERLQCEENPR